jgi:membrane fusion protein YbhG
MKTKLLVLLGILVLAVVVVFGARSWMGSKQEGMVASGTLEARNISVGSKVGGRVTQVLVQEGDHVDPNQLLLSFDEAELKAQLQQAKGRVEQAQANLKKLERGSRVEEIAEARASAASTERAVSQAQAQLKSAQAEAWKAGQDYQRMDTLYGKGVVPRQMRDDAQARQDATSAQVRGMESAVEGATERLRAARASLELVESGPRKEDIQAARAQVVSAQGDLALAEARWAEREVRSPASAVVETLDLRPGDLIPANAPVAKLLESDQLYVMVYVPQEEVGRVQVGQKANVKVDAFPDESFTATVEQIRQQAEFLPRNVQTREERQHQVFGVKLRVENPSRRLRAGVQADVQFVEAQ